MLSAWIDVTRVETLKTTTSTTDDHTPLFAAMTFVAWLCFLLKD
jgi:hypothetical protein